MNRYAGVDSIEALRNFRVVLCSFAAMVKSAIEEADADVKRTAGWLALDRQHYWKNELRRRAEELHRAKLVLQTRKNEKTPLGGRYSCVDEKKAFEKAKRRYEEAQRKAENVKKWMRRFEQESLDFKAASLGVRQVLENEMPNALAGLDQMLGALDDYVALHAPSGAIEESASGTNGPGMARPELCDDHSSKAQWLRQLATLAPSIEQRRRPMLQDIDFKWPKLLSLDQRQRALLQQVDIQPQLIAPAQRIIIGSEVWNAGRIFLHRTRCDENDSGWYVGLVDGPPPSEFIAVQVGDLLAQRADWSELLQLPAGCTLVVDGTTIEALADTEGRIVNLLDTE